MSGNEEEVVHPPYNFTWIVKDELAAMACPKTLFNIRFLKKEGIKHLVTLSPESAPPIRTFSDLKWTEIPIEDLSPPSVSQIKKFIDVCLKCKTEDQVSVRYP